MGSSKWLLKVVLIPNRFLGMLILVLSFVGVYSLRNSFTDCAIAVVFGVLGFILKRLELPIVPIILGMVLGGIMEIKLRTSMPRIDTLVDFINRPVSAVLFSLIIGAILVHIITMWRQNKRMQVN